MFKKLTIWFKSNWRILLVTVLSVGVASGGSYLCQRYLTKNMYYRFGIFELTLITMWTLTARYIIFRYRSRSIRLHNIISYALIILASIGGLVYFSIRSSGDSRIEIMLSFITLILTLPTILEYINKNHGIWRILIYPTNSSDIILYRPNPKFYASVKLNREIKIYINARNLKDVEASISFFGVFNDNQFNTFKENTYIWKLDFLLKNYLAIDCIKRIETPYESVNSFGQSKSNIIVFTPSESNNENKFMMRINDENYGTSIILNEDEVENGLTLHFVYLDIFNEIYDYPLHINLK